MDYRSLKTQADDVIIDLSSHWRKLEAYEDISDDLSEEEEAKLVDYIRACGKLSHTHISKLYPAWKEADQPSLAAILCSNSKV